MKTIASTSKKIQEFDTLRALAITILMVHHSGFYGLKIFGISPGAAVAYVEAILLGIFLFSSGYFYERSFQKQNKGNVRLFFSRMLRIYPPYFLALFLFIVILDISLRKRDLLVYLLGAQFIFAPDFVQPVMTIWYIGAIVLFYIIFGLLLGAVHSTRQLIFCSILVFTIAYALHQWMGLIDDRFFKYFIVFLTGILFARSGVQSNLLSGGKVILKLLFALICSLAFSRVLSANPLSPLYLLGVVMYVISWVVLLFELATRVNSTVLLKWINLVAYASFFVYLLHRPLWGFLLGVFSVENPVGQVLFKLIPASLVVFIASYFLQSGYDRLLAVFTGKSN